MIAALYVAKGGCYTGLSDVDAWDVDRDARKYAGPYPVVAHPPCSRWCALAGLVEARWGHKRGEDEGCFAAALAAVRAFGGVLEHPAHSKAWPAYDLPRPSRSGGWQRGACGGWSAHVEQANYGHRARKATWLYAYGVELPALRWGRGTAATVDWCTPGTSLLNARGKVVETMSKRERLATPPAFRDLLLSIARSAAQKATNV